ncbi:MAG: nucleotide exchange factor GrpE [Alphaproteobacteria bacterium]|nr:nucleotide exchange factor GrpE [Alphaproteobacteria bacterium]
MQSEHEQPPPAGAPEAANDAAPEPTPEARIQALEGEVASLKDQLLRALAENENVRRRGERERAEAGKYAVAKFAEALLNVADSLRQALGTPTAGPPEALRQGVELTERALTAALEAHGIRRFDPLGEAFDPHRHQAVFEIEDGDKPAGAIAQTLRAGFMLHDRLLRPAMVAVAKGGPAPQAEDLHVDTSA